MVKKPNKFVIYSIKISLNILNMYFYKGNNNTVET